LKGVFIQTKGANRTKQNKAKVLLLLMFSAIDTIEKEQAEQGAVTCRNYQKRPSILRIR
jgi:hypothetical protein